MTTSAASKGTCVHKALELLGLRQLAIQRNESKFHDEETNKTYELDKFKFDDAINNALSFYINDKKVLTTVDIPDCVEWYNISIDKYKSYTPLGQKVLTVEEHFDFELPYDWANYEYEVQGEVYKGRLGLKGTMDLLFDIDEDTIEYVDYKTGGSNRDWLSGKSKDSVTLLDDFQLQLYYYAIRKHYPHIKNILCTMLFIRAGGPFTPPFDDSYLPIIENNIREKFEEIRDNKKPNNIKRGLNKFKCNWCPFKKNVFEHSSNPSKKSYCDFFEQEIKQIGLERVTNKYFDPKTIGLYEGGGRSIKNSVDK